MHLYLLTLAGLELIRGVEGYCPGLYANPGFKSAPRVNQVSMTSVEVDWRGLVTRADCADQFLVKSWLYSNPNHYKISNLLTTDTFSTVVEDLLPNQEYIFQAVAREDKWLLGKEWNRSPKKRFRISRSNPTVVPRLYGQPGPAPALKTRENQEDSNEVVQYAGNAHFGLSVEQDGDPQPYGLVVIFILSCAAVILVILVSGGVYNTMKYSRKRRRRRDTTTSDSFSSSESLDIQLSPQQQFYMDEERDLKELRREAIKMEGMMRRMERKDRRTESTNRGTQTPQCSCSKTPVLARKEIAVGSQDTSTNTTFDEINPSGDTVNSSNTVNFSNTVTSNDAAVSNTEQTTVSPTQYKDAMVYVDDETLSSDGSEHVTFHIDKKRDPPLHTNL